MAISYGSKGAAVVALQNQLKSMMGVPSVDGDYGAQTESAVQTAYQMLNVTPVSGAASDELLGALNAAVGPGNTVIGATPPGGGVVGGANVTSTWGLDLSKGTLASLSTPVKIGLGVVGVALLAGVFSKK